MRKSVLAFFLLGFLAGMALLLGGCGARPILSDVEVSPGLISPNADGVADVTRISYRLTASAALSIYLVGADGTKHYFRQDQRRSAGRYGVDFGGVVDGRMLPDGDYELVVEAVDGEGRIHRMSRPLSLRDADTTPPELLNFSVYPRRFTPNQDGYDDRVKVSYYLTKPADVRVFLVDKAGNRFPLAEQEGVVKPGEVGTHIYDYAGGVDEGLRALQPLRELGRPALDLSGPWRRGRGRDAASRRHLRDSGRGPR